MSSYFRSTTLYSQIAREFKQKIEMIIIKLILGLIFIFLGWIYLYNPKLVSRLNKIARDKLFNDRRVLLERKKLAIMFFVLSFIALYMGYSAMVKWMMNKDSDTWLFNPTEYIMYLASQDCLKGDHERALKRYKSVLDNSPENTEALKKMSSIYLSLGNKSMAKNLVVRALKVKPKDNEAKILLKEIERRK